MKFAYQFSNLLGTVYCKGDLVFSPDGNSLISPVGNRLSVFDLKNNKASTLPVESSFNYTTVALSPCGNILLAVNEDGDAHLISLISRRIIHRYHFSAKVQALRFSPDGKYFAACKDFGVMVFRAPSLGEFGAFSLARAFMGANDTATCLDWSSDSNIIAFGSSDCAVRLYPMGTFANFGMYVLGGHSSPVVAVFFERGTYNVITVIDDGTIYVWECNVMPVMLRPKEIPPPKRSRTAPASDDEDEIAAPRNQATVSNTNGTLDAAGDSDSEDGEPSRREAKMTYKRKMKKKISLLLSEKDKHFLPKLTSAAYHNQNRTLVAGFEQGTFLVVEMPECNLIHSLNFADQPVTSIALNNTGDWIALASAEHGQLLVWEWQSETYVMKQQGHTANMSCIAYSGDGQFVVTGGEDGKVKLWNTTTGFCFVTFSEHTSAIVSVVFSNNRKFIVSASLDGTIRAFDLTRYRNFRTLTSPQPVQFSCLALDSTNEFVAAGCQDVFEIYLWSMKLNKLVEIIYGHEGPVSGIAFSPSLTSSAMASVSWDSTMRMWDAVDIGSHGEPFALPALGLAVAWSPDGNTIAVSTLNAEVTFVDAKTTQQIGSLQGRADLGAGVLRSDLISAKKNLEGKAFTSLCFGPDGRTILCGGVSKFVCIYSTEEYLLVRKIQITQNRSFDGMEDMINRRKMTEWGNAELWDERSTGDNLKMPGSRTGDIASRSTPPEVRVFSLHFSPTGQAFGAATTEGLLIYSLDPSLWFDPFQLNMAVTPASIRLALQRGENTLALASAVRLNEANVLQEAFESIPLTDVELTVSTLPLTYVPRVLRFVASGLERSRHVDLYTRWARWLLTTHGSALCPSGAAGADIMPTLLNLQKSMTEKHDSLAKMCDYNKYSIQFLLNLGKFKTDWHKEEEAAKEGAGKEEVEETEMEQTEEADDEDMLMYL